jgi:hypothetical protein
LNYTPRLGLDSWENIEANVKNVEAIGSNNSIVEGYLIWS